MEMFNNNNLSSNNSANFGGQYPVVNSSVDKTKTSSAEYTHSWRRQPRPFGLNVRVPQNPIGARTQTLIANKIKELAMAPVQPVIDYFKANENVFNGNIATEIENLQKQEKLTISLLQDSDEIVMQTEHPNFMMDM